MPKISDITGKPVISLYEAQLQGYVSCVLADKKLKKIHYADIASEGQRYLMPVRYIYLVNDAVLIKNDNHISPFESVVTENLVSCPVGASVYSLSGLLEGELKDIAFDKNGYVSEVISDKRKYLPEEIAAAGDEVIIVRNGEKMPVLRKNRRVPAAKKDLPVKIIEPTEKANRAAPDLLRNADGTIDFGAFRKPEMMEDFEFLLGRRVLKNIYSRKRSLIIRQGATVDLGVLAVAERYFKLVELTLHSEEV